MGKGCPSRKNSQLMLSRVICNSKTDGFLFQSQRSERRIDMFKMSIERAEPIDFV